MVFTVAESCDYCIFVMSMISRPLANLPHPFEFGTSRKGSRRFDRVGIASSVYDHKSFIDFVSKSTLELSIMAERYRDLLIRSPKKVVIVDFESLPIFRKGLRMVPTEVTFRYGNGEEILSALINEDGVTNAEFEERIKKLGYTDERCLESCRRIRGMPNRGLKGIAMNPKQILRVLRKSGFNRETFWVEYSIGYYDRQCMAEVIRQAGKLPEDVLPPLSQCWPVCSDFMRCLPGKWVDSLKVMKTIGNAELGLGTSYRLGSVARLMNPGIVKGQKLHTSRADTFILYQFLRHWVNVYGAEASTWSSSEGHKRGCEGEHSMLSWKRKRFSES